jgi:hypothetical protein
MPGCGVRPASIAVCSVDRDDPFGARDPRWCQLWGSTESAAIWCRARSELQDANVDALSARILSCVRQARDIMRVAAQEDLRALRTSPEPFDSYLGIDKKMLLIKWNGGFGALMKQTGLVALRIVLLAIFALLVPVRYGLHLIQRARKIRAQEVRIAQLSTIPAFAPTCKTIDELWRAYGLDDDAFAVDTQAALLENWVEVLYGVETARRLDVQGRASAKMAQRREMHRPLYEGKEGAIHFHFAPIAESIAEELSKALPTLRESRG